MKQISGNAQKAKLTALKEAHKMAKDMLGDDLKGLKKVTVAAPNKEGLKAGLEKAEEMMGDESESEESEQSDESENEEYGDKSDEIVEECESPEEIDALIAKLQEKKKQLQA